MTVVASCSLSPARSRWATRHRRSANRPPRVPVSRSTTGSAPGDRPRPDPSVHVRARRGVMVEEARAGGAGGAAPAGLGRLVLRGGPPVVPGCPSQGRLQYAGAEAEALPVAVDRQLPDAGPAGTGARSGSADGRPRHPRGGCRCARCRTGRPGDVPAGAAGRPGRDAATTLGRPCAGCAATGCAGTTDPAGRARNVQVQPIAVLARRPRAGAPPQARPRSAAPPRQRPCPGLGSAGRGMCTEGGQRSERIADRVGW